MGEQNKENMTLTEKADAAFRQAARKIIQQARQTDTPIIVWENGRIKTITKEHFDTLMSELEQP
jgi:hypothetical protein